MMITTRYLLKLLVFFVEALHRAHDRRLARSRVADHHQVAERLSLQMLEDRHGDEALRLFLTDDVLLEELVDLDRYHTKTPCPRKGHYSVGDPPTPGDALRRGGEEWTGFATSPRQLVGSFGSGESSRTRQDRGAFVPRIRSIVFTTVDALPVEGASPGLVVQPADQPRGDIGLEIGDVDGVPDPCRPGGVHSDRRHAVPPIERRLSAA